MNIRNENRKEMHAKENILLHHRPPSDLRKAVQGMQSNVNYRIVSSIDRFLLLSDFQIHCLHCDSPKFIVELHFETMSIRNTALLKYASVFR
jgi:hypothetical protein